MRHVIGFAAIAAVAAFAGTSSGIVIFNNPGATYTNNFNTVEDSGGVRLSGLPKTGSVTPWTNFSATNGAGPGWFVRSSGSGTTAGTRDAGTAAPSNGTVAGTGSATAGGLYSFGSAGSTERALGDLGSNNAAAGDFWIGVVIRNTTGQTLTDVSISLRGEQWRAGNVASQRMISEYQISSSFTFSGPGNIAGGGPAGWTQVPELDVVSVTNSTAGAIDGNVNSTALSKSLTGLTWADQDYLVLRWWDDDHAGSDHGLAIDDFSFTANAIPTPGAFAIAGVAGLVIARRKR